ncbi:hypothetical protein ZWY2020_008117 [Hordeum vulgare]|nr:hypothetical protein ZWY2020_008117 [Hordeum vulgare]
MDDTHPSSATDRETAETARNSPAPPPQLKTRDEQMSFLVSTIPWMEKNISVILLNQKSLERIVEKKCHDLDVKVTELTTSVQRLQHEVDSVKIPRSDDEYDDDDDSPLRTTTRFTTQTRSATVPVLEERLSPSTQASAPAPAPPLSTLPAPALATSTEAFVYVLALVYSNFSYRRISCPEKCLD